MNDKLATILAYIFVGYIIISWIFAILLFFYEIFIGPIFNAFAPEINASYNLLVQQTNINESQIITQINQLVPIPINQFIESELTLIIPPAILLGLIYYEAKKENHDE
jgi:hypothetical protein